MPRRAGTAPPCPSYQLLHDLARHIRQPKIAALKAIRELLMVQTEKVQNARVEIIHVHRVFGDPPAEFIRLANHLSAAHAAASHPHAESDRMMIPPGHA